MKNKLIYETPSTRAVPFSPEGNFCQSYPSVTVTFGGDGGGSGGDDGFFDDEIQW